MNQEQRKEGGVDPVRLPVWHVVTVVVAPGDAEALADVLRTEFDREPVILEKPHAAYTWLELYWEEEEKAQVCAASVRDGDARVLAVCIRRCDARDWTTFWQTHFRPRPVGRHLFLCPAWETPPAEAAQRMVLRMTPGLSFGTGEHFTTRFVLETLDALSDRKPVCTSLWDVGCGSGVLAVAAALLGFQHVLGTDHDPLCVAQSAENASMNGVSSRIIWREHDILQAQEPGLYDVVCANLFSRLLIAAASSLWNATGRYLVLSGIREFEVEDVATAFDALGAQEIMRDGDGDWAGVLFARRQGAEWLV